MQYATYVNALPLILAQMGLAPRTRTGPPALPVTDPTVQGVTPRQATEFVL
jgi:hypothetical protein